MARLPRLYAPATPQLVQTRLVAPACLLAGQPPAPALLDQQADWLGEESARHRVAVHGWVLTYDQLVFIATPTESDSIPALVQAYGRRLAAQRGGGRVFEGRYRSALVEPAAWLLPALAWLEALPVRARLSGDPEHWRWSSAAVHAGGFPGYHANWLALHPDYWASGNTPFERQAAWRDRLQTGLTASAADAVTQALQGQWALGSESFVARMGDVASRRVAPGKRGRPRKTPLVTD